MVFLTASRSQSTSINTPAKFFFYEPCVIWESRSQLEGVVLWVFAWDHLLLNAKVDAVTEVGDQRRCRPSPNHFGHSCVVGTSCGWATADIVISSATRSCWWVIVRVTREPSYRPVVWASISRSTVCWTWPPIPTFWVEPSPAGSRGCREQGRIYGGGVTRVTSHSPGAAAYFMLLLCLWL